MRSFLFASAVVGLAAAAPAPLPQDIDFDLAYALPNPTYTQAVGATAQVVTYNPTTVFSAALSQITATSSDDGEESSVASTTGSPDKRDAASCAPQPSGYGPVPSPDTASAFLADPAFASAASAAPTPSGYSVSFVDAQASNNAYGYMGYTTLETYDVDGCAAQCNTINGCISINIYYERDPTVDPGSGDSGCSDPSSTTTIKCVFWGGPVTSSNAVNTGQYRNQFQVVIAGSNGYTNNSVAAVPGYDAAVYLGNAAINAPYDQYGFNTYMGSAIFIGPFDAELCAQACTAKSDYALQHPPTDGSPTQTCQFFNTYILYINNTNDLQGQYCAMYSETWSSSYATNVGQYQGSNDFLIEYSFAYSNSTNPGEASPLAAVYQASADITYATLQTYCSSQLGYTTPVVTATITATTTPLATTTVTTTASETITVQARRKRQASSSVSPSSSLSLTTSGSVIMKAPTQTLAARSAASTPDVLTKYPASIVSSACSLVATAVSSTSTTTQTVTTTAATVVTSSVVTVTNTATVTSTPVATCLPEAANGDATGYDLSALCDTTVSTGFVFESSSTQSSALSCLQAADADFYALAFTYVSSSKLCTFYLLSNRDDAALYSPHDGSGGPATVESAPGIIFGYYDQLVSYGYLSLSD